MNLKPYRIKRLKWGEITCSKECDKIVRSRNCIGERNHQHGLIGHLNASFKPTTLINNYGYVLEYCPGHPRPHDRNHKGVRVKQHRLVVERNSHLFPDDFFEIVDGWKVLKKEYHVHHVDENRLNNDISNLQVMTLSEHTKLHAKLRRIQKRIGGFGSTNEQTGPIAQGVFAKIERPASIAILQKERTDGFGHTG